MKKLAARTGALLALGVVIFGSLVACTGESDDSDGDSAGGGSGTESPSVVSSFVLDAGTESEQDVRVAVHGVRRVEAATVLDWSVTPLATQEKAEGDPVGQALDINVAPWHENGQALSLLDVGSQQVYRPLDNDEDVAGCLCVPWFTVRGELTVGETRLMQAAFPELPDELEAITVAIRNQPLVSEVPVAPIGSITTGEGMDLAAAAEDLPTAGEAQEFTYPVADALEDPAQEMSLQLNEVVNGADGASLVFTVTALADGDGLDAFGGRPVNDPAVVQHGTSLYDTRAAGPGVAPGGGEAQLIRPWFASVRQKEQIPPGAAEGFAWRDCLCPATLEYGRILRAEGRSITLVQQMPAMPGGTETVDVVFPDDSLPTVTDVPVSAEPNVASELGSEEVEVETWTYGSVESGDLPRGWSLDEWPTPVPSAEDIEGSDAVVDELEEVYSDQASMEKKDPEKVEVTLDSTVSFEPDSARLTARARTTIERVAADIDAADAEGAILVEGHVSGTDQGSRQVQQSLSEDRANAVRDALEGAVASDVGFESIGKGASEPVAPNDVEENRAKNRRVVVTYER